MYFPPGPGLFLKVLVPFLSGSGTNTLLEELKNNERENFRTMAEKVRTSLHVTVHCVTVS